MGSFSPFRVSLHSTFSIFIKQRRRPQSKKGAEDGKKSDLTTTSSHRNVKSRLKMTTNTRYDKIYIHLDDKYKLESD